MSQHTDAQEQRVAEATEEAAYRVAANLGVLLLTALQKLSAPDSVVSAIQDGDLEHVQTWLDASQPASAAPHKDSGSETLSARTSDERTSQSGIVRWIRDNCKVIYWPNPDAYPIEHAPLAGKLSWELIEQAYREARSGSTNAAGGSSRVGGVSGTEWTVRQWTNATGEPRNSWDIYCGDTCITGDLDKVEAEAICAAHNASLRADGRAETGDDTKRLDEIFAQTSDKTGRRRIRLAREISGGVEYIRTRSELDTAIASSNPEPVSSPASSQEDSGSETRSPQTDVARTDQSDTSSEDHLPQEFECRHCISGRHNLIKCYEMLHSDNASVSRLMRRFRLGQQHALDVFAKLEELGVISPSGVSLIPRRNSSPVVSVSDSKTSVRPASSQAEREEEA